MVPFATFKFQIFLKIELAWYTEYFFHRIEKEILLLEGIDLALYLKGNTICRTAVENKLNNVIISYRTFF